MIETLCDVRPSLHRTEPQEDPGTAAITEAGAEAWLTERLPQFPGWDGD